ncbi:MAG TPA: PQQ-dependent sugar dehydrogenase [Cyclobacteriaceae bacterium]|nr:PQQ-dependent sugar dehydrogenase [Cyclobacteriaceae bacterium]
MKKELHFISAGLIFISLSFYFNACTTKSSPDTSSIATDSVTIAKGKDLFGQNCSACHTFRQDGIGPRLSGLTAEISAEQIKNFIKGPKGIIDAGDERARKLVERFKTIMPSFDYYTDEQVNSIIAFLHTKKVQERRPEKGDGTELKDPIPDSIPLSGLVVGLELVAQIPASSDKPMFTRITKLAPQPNTGNLFVVDLRGKLYELQKNQPVVYMDMAKLRPHFINQPGLATGFGSFAFHPEFAKNGLLYTTHTEAPGSGKADFSYADSIPVTVQWVLTEWKTKQPASSPFSGEGRELFRVNMVTGIHGVQDINFNPFARPGDKEYGLLYIGVGDGGSVEEHYPLPTQKPERIWGTVVRINPSGRNSDNGKYGIPVDNPFSKTEKGKGLREVYATGFRNPHKISWSKAGQMFVGNIGQRNIESLYLVEPGHFHGWPIREGTFLIRGNIDVVYALPADDSIYHVSYPVAQFDHDEGIAMSGGFEYSGTSIPQLTGKFVFGDINAGRLFYVEMADIKLGSQAPIKEWGISMGGARTTLVELAKYNRADMRFGRDAKGELYLVMKPDGKVYRLVPGP